jgi:hypothetical protein
MPFDKQMHISKLPNLQNNFHRIPMRQVEKYNDFLQDNGNEDCVYYDITIRNNTNQDIVAEYYESKSSSIINNPSEYYLTIVKFRISASALRIFNFDSNTYGIGMKFDGYEAFQYVEYVPVHDTNGTSNADGQQPVYDYQSFISMINIAFRKVVIKLWEASGHTMPIQDPTDLANPVPMMIYNGESSPIIIRFPEAWKTVGVAQQDKIVTYFNYQLYLFFQNFKTYFTNFDDPYAFRFIVDFEGDNYGVASPDGTGDIRLPADRNAYNYYDMSQDGTTFSNWYDISEIVVTSNTIPMVKEIFGSKTTEGTDQYFPILTDVSTNFLGTTPGQQKADIIYIPTPQYRLISLNSHTDLNTIDFQFSYRDYKGQINPLYIGPGLVCTMKLLFIKRSLFNNSV